MAVLHNARFLSQQVFPSLINCVIFFFKKNVVSRSSVKQIIGILREEKNKFVMACYMCQVWWKFKLECNSFVILHIRMFLSNTCEYAVVLATVCAVRRKMWDVLR